MRGIRLLVIVALIFLPAASFGGASFDGKWLAKMTCPPKGNTEGYTWQFPSSILNGNFHGEHGATGQPGYLAIDGSVADDGSAKLTANGIVASRDYARGVFAHQGESYSYDIKAQFKETTGTGARNQGLGIVGRPCTFEFTKQPPANPPAAR
ncbi:MAG: hypothetical protein ACLQG3_16875 [Terracidiphilus sp.]